MEMEFKHREDAPYGLCSDYGDGWIEGYNRAAQEANEKIAKLEQLIQNMHKSRNPDLPPFDIEAALTVLDD